MFPEQPPDLLWGLHPRQILPSPVRNHHLDLEPFWYGSVPTPESGNTLIQKLNFALTPYRLFQSPPLAQQSIAVRRIATPN